MLLNIPKSMREELQEVLDELVPGRKVGDFEKRKIWKAGNICCDRYFYRTFQRFWFCDSGRE